jgi:hypothetical protein
MITMTKPYERELYVNTYYGVELFRVTERPMLDPRFDTDPVEKIELLDNQRGWVDLTGKLTPKQEAAVMDAWQRAYDKDYCDDEATVPSLCVF